MSRGQTVSPSATYLLQRCAARFQACVVRLRVWLHGHSDDWRSAVLNRYLSPAISVERPRQKLISWTEEVGS